MTKKKATKLAPVVRDDKARVVTGSLNPGGLTKEQRAARDALNQWLCDEPQMKLGKESYRLLLMTGNPVIVKDFMDRIAGKVKESVALDVSDNRPLRDVTDDMLVEYVRLRRQEKP